MAGSEHRVLIVDDNAENRLLACATLEDDGYEVSVARDGAEAIREFERTLPGCILLDIQMPGIDGIEACERIRTLPGGDLVAIVFVTARREIATFDRALAAGGDDFVTKPYRPSELVVRVQTALRLRKLAGERSELYAQVKRQRDDLQRLQIQKEQLSAFLIHDLKNPVSSIELQAERLLRDPAANERGRSAAVAIRTETRALMRMLLNLLDLSLADEGELVPVVTELDLASVVEAVLDEHRGAAADAGVALATDLAIDRPVAADGTLLRRVLANLLENAIRHAPEASAVRVIARRDGEATELRVCDAGPGVPEALRDQVFQRFETAGGSRNRGLGLAFCKVALDAHGGRIWVEDAHPGAAFCMRIPDVRG